MSIESIAFDRRRPIIDKLIADGDIAHAVITAEIAGGDFIAETIIQAELPGVELGGLIVAKEGAFTIKSRVYDPETDEEYAPIRQEGAIGSYAATVREEYQEFLNSVADSYCLEAQFLSDQAKAGRSYWIIPSNPVQYDVVMGFMTSPNNTISWTQRIQAEVGDYLYIYQTNPVASIMHKCEVVRANVPRSEAYGIDDIVAKMMESKKTKPVMFLKLLETYPVGHYSREFMNEHGIKKTIRGQRSMPLELVEAMEQNKVLK